MFLWYLALPFFARLRPVPALISAVVFGLLIGIDSNSGTFLALSRCIVFFPFFLAGYHFREEWIRKPGVLFRVLAALFLVAALLILFWRYDSVKQYLSILYASSSYYKMSFSTFQGILVRMIWYLIAAVLTGSLLCLVPRKRLFFYVHRPAHPGHLHPAPGAA